MILLLRYWKATLIASLALALMMAIHVNDVHQQELGAMTERMRQVAARNDSLQARIGDSDRHIQKDTVVVTRVATEYDTLYQTRETRLTDTVYVKQIIAKGDTLVRACRMLVADCALANARKDTLIGNLKEQLALQTKIGRPSKLGLAVKLGAAVGVGYLLGRH